MTSRTGTGQQAFELGEHYCFLYQNEEEQRSLVTRYLRNGLEQNEKVVYIADTGSRSAISEFLEKDDLQVEAFCRRGQLLIQQAENTFLSGGSFDFEAAIEWMRTETRRARQDGFKTLRIASEMTWATQKEPGCERLIEFECMLDQVIPEISCIYLAQYDRRRFDPNLLLGIFAANRRVMVGPDSYENPYYLAPNHSLRVEQPSQTLERWLDHLVSSRQANEALRQAKEYAEKLIETANVMIVGLDENGSLQVFNEAAEKITGYDRTELKGRNWFEMFVPKDRHPDGWEVFHKWRAGNHTQSRIHENPILTKSGNERFISWQNNKIEEDGKFKGMISFGIDITERIRVEKALRESEHKYREILESASEAIVIIRADRKIVFFNKKAEEIFGYGREEVLGQDLEILIPDDSRHGHAQKLKFYFESPHVRPTTEGSLELAGKHKSGRVFPTEIGLSVIDIGSERLGINFITDVSGRKNLEAQLLQAQKMEAVGKLAGGVAHDFNNLLTAINGYSEIVIKSLKSDDPLRETVGEIKRAGERAAALTRQLLAFSRKQVLRPTVLNLNVVITNLDNMLRRLIGVDVRLIVRLAPDLGLTKADPGQIEQVVMNLAVNARDAMPQGGTLRIETLNVDITEADIKKLPGMKPGPCVLLMLIDTGCGMDVATQAHIFEPFFTTKEVGKGTGLGLSTAYGIVKQSGGCIYALSDPGRGSTFKVYLPRVDETIFSSQHALESVQ